MRCCKAVVMNLPTIRIDRRGVNSRDEDQPWRTQRLRLLQERNFHVESQP